MRSGRLGGSGFQSFGAQAARHWPTLVLLVVCYALWGAATVLAGPGLGIIGVAVSVALHSSLCHEALHGHPFRNRHLNAALVFPALSVVVPYMRFRATHIAHHRDDSLTDPYDDPESHFLDPACWARLPRIIRLLLRVNNTLAGRLLIGPVVGQVGFLWTEWRARDRAVLLGWLWHLPAAGLVLWWMTHVAALPGWAWGLGTYGGLSILKLRTFLEHRAHHDPAARTVIIEDRGLFALLFLGNNLHVVHHRHPGLPWFRLWPEYARNRAAYLALNDGYVYPSYAEVIRRHFWRAKDPVPHPLWPSP